MKVHQMKLSSNPFNKIKSGNKKIESRLFDDKRQQICIGDEIVFSENDNDNNKIHTEVIGLLRYKNFKDLFEDHSPTLFGEDTVEFLQNQIKSFYTDADESLFGVVGIRIKLID
jgi:ASC-1-like (ASCH) protein